MTDKKMLSPVVIGLGNYCNNVLDLCIQAEMWSGGEKERCSLAPYADILYHNGAQQPERHLLIFALQTSPTRSLAARGG